MALRSCLGMTPGESHKFWPSGFTPQVDSVVYSSASPPANNVNTMIYKEGRYSGLTGMGTKGLSNNAINYVDTFDTVNPLIIGFARQQDSLLDFGTSVLEVYSTNNSLLFSITVNTSRTLGLTGLAGVAMPSVTIANDVWHYFEVKFLPANTGGILEVRLNGETILNFTGDTYPWVGSVLPVGRIAFPMRTQTSAHQNTFRAPVSYGDIYIADTSGTSNNDFLGEVRIDRVVPSGNGSVSEFVGSDGNSTDNYLLVADENPVLGRYVQSDVLGAKDLYTMSDLPLDASNIVAVMPRGVASKPEVGTAALASVLKTSAGEITTPPTVLTSALTPLSTSPYPQKPGGGAWTREDVNNLEVGVKVVNA